MTDRNQSKLPDATEIRWEWDADTPADDFFDGSPIETILGLQEAVENFIFALEQKDFVTWEAVIRTEQGLPLTAPQERLLGGLVSFGKPDDESDGERILYIDGLPRPSEPWSVILNKIVPHLLIEPFVTSQSHYEVQASGWNRLVQALREHGQELSLPAGVATPEEVVPPEIRHRLWLQDAIEILGGLGQADELNLADQSWRIDEFVQSLRERRPSVEYLDLTLDSLMERVILPERDRPLFAQSMKNELGLAHGQDRIADRL